MALETPNNDRKGAGPRHEDTTLIGGAEGNLTSDFAVALQPGNGDLGKCQAQKLVCRGESIPEVCAGLKVGLGQRLASRQHLDALRALFANVLDLIHEQGRRNPGGCRRHFSPVVLSRAAIHGLEVLTGCGSSGEVAKV